MKNFLALLQERYQGSMESMARDDLEALRPVLLEVKGIGPETADSILLYALNKPTFVVDAYTFRILSRHHLAPESCTYEELRRLFMDHLTAGRGALSGIPRPAGAPGEGIMPAPTPMRGLFPAGLALISFEFRVSSLREPGQEAAAATDGLIIRISG